MSDRKKAIPLPILDPKATAARSYPVWALEEWRKKYQLYSPREALRRKHVRCELGPVGDEDHVSFKTYPKYLQHLCTECRGEGEVDDPLIVGCRIYACEVWPYRWGKNPSRAGIGTNRKYLPKPSLSKSE